MLLPMLVPVTVYSLLGEMNDLDRLAWPATYRAAQASSYDRASKSPKVDWFANGDAGQYVRDEVNGGRKEHVMADLQGPGTVTRIWSANPASTVRFYFDGESAPRLQAPLGDLLRGKAEPFGSTYAYESSKGCNLYFPFPYSKSLKITVDDSGDVRGLYYHIGYRTYRAGTAVETFQPGSFNPPPESSPKQGAGAPQQAAGKVSRGEALTLRLKGPGVLSDLSVQLPPQDGRPRRWADPEAIHNVLSSLVLTVDVDGEPSVVAPVGDFFATAPGVTPLQSLPMTVSPSGLLTCRFPMPFAKSLRVSVENRGGAQVNLKLSALVDHPSALPPYRFHAQWEYDRGRTRPMRDLPFVQASGEGRFVGSFLHVENPTPAWWGEGDEKVYVDGEAFPSTFGTGTEDYYGYAWCWPAAFEKPYHGQPRVDGPGNFGHTTVYRWQIFDDIPFTQSLSFNLEMWHWADVTATWARTSYWYAAPGATGNHAIKVAKPTELVAPQPVKGAIEGEALRVLEATGGKHEVQDGFWEISDQKQRWWMDAQAADKLVLILPVPEDGRFEIVANLCHAKDYGIHEIALDGKKLKTIDFYSDALGWKKETLGTLALKKGEARLEITCRGVNKNAIPRAMFGLDYLLLKRVGN